MFFYVSFCTIIIVNYFRYCYIILIHLIYSLLISFLHFFYMHMFLLNLLTAILLTSSENTFFYFSLLNLCRDFDINLLSFLNSLPFFSKTIHIKSIVLDGLLFFCKLSCLLTVFTILKWKFLFYDTILCAFCFFSLIIIIC